MLNTRSYVSISVDLKEKHAVYGLLLSLPLAIFVKYRGKFAGGRAPCSLIFFFLNC